jgi:hypothetical protein
MSVGLRNNFNEFPSGSVTSSNLKTDMAQKESKKKQEPGKIIYQHQIIFGKEKNGNLKQLQETWVHWIYT